jgi:DNA mismatch repair protein MutL
VAVLNVAVPLADVDVNVHPAKAEVRFRRSGLVFSALQQAVRRTLTTHSPVPEMKTASASLSTRVIQPGRRPFWPSAPAGQAAAAPLLATPLASGGLSLGHGLDSVAPAAEPRPLAPREALPALRVLGQVQTTYIAAEGPDGVYLIDQHAAHERVLFEKALASSVSQPPEVQSLLEPATVELDPRQREMADSQAGLIAALGFQFEPFGGSSYLLRGVPSLLSEGDAGQSFVDVLDLMAEGGGFETWEERAAYSMACHGAVRTGKALSQQEMTELTRLLETCRQPHTCPHGRPTMIHLSSATLEREFGRR